MAVNALSYVPVIVWSLTQPYTGHADVEDSVRHARRLEWRLTSAVETLKGAASNRTILAMLGVAGATSLLVGNAHLAQMPAFAEEFAGSSDGLVYSSLLLAGAVGAIFGGLLQETLPLLSPSPRKAVLLAIAWASAMLAFAFASAHALALTALFVAGILQISFMAMAQAIVQLEAPSERRGRIMGVFNMAANGLRVGSGLSVGFFAAVVGVHWALGLSAAVVVMALVVWYVALYGRVPISNPSS
jgi:MFS family permease